MRVTYQMLQEMASKVHELCGVKCQNGMYNVVQKADGTYFSLSDWCTAREAYYYLSGMLALKSKRCGMYFSNSQIKQEG